MERMVKNMLVTKEREESKFFKFGPLLIFLVILLIGACVLYIGTEQLLGLIILGIGLFWAVFSFRIVRPAFAGLLFRFGGRVIISETIRYFRIVDGQEQDILAEEFNDPAFDPEAPDVKSEISLEYLIKKEGWTFIFPVLEKIVQISLRQYKAEINTKRPNESEEAYLSRAESFSTAEGISIFPVIFYSNKVVNPGEVFELGGGIDENGDSPFLVEMLHDLVIGGARGILAKTELTEILAREVKDGKGNIVSINEKIRTEVIKTPNFGRLGTKFLILRIADIKFTKEAEDVLRALEEIKKQKFSRESQVIEADMKLQVQMIDSETLINKSGAELTRVRNEALAFNAEIAAFVGKKVDEKTTAEDGKAFADYKTRLALAKTLETSTKVIVPADQLSTTLAGLVNVFEASKP